MPFVILSTLKCLQKGAFCASFRVKMFAKRFARSLLLLKGTVADMRYFAKSKFSRSLLHKKIFSLI